MLQQEYASKSNDEAFKRLIERIGSNVTSMTKLIDDLPAFSKYQRQDLSKSLIDMEKMVREY